MNKEHLIKKLQRVIPTKNFAKKVLDLIIEEIAQALRRGEKVVIGGLGVFEPYIGRTKLLVHPQTKKKITINPRRRVRFRLTRNFFKND